MMRFITTVITFATLAALAGSLVGCTSTAVVESSTPPEYFTLELHMATSTRKFTFFKIDKDGGLAFGGGKRALVRGSLPVTTLTSEQRQAVWEIIRQNDLLNANGGSNSAPQQEQGKDDEQVKWELLIRTNQFSLGRTLRSENDEVPGIKELHALLFKIQAAHRYSDPVGIG